MSRAEAIASDIPDSSDLIDRRIAAFICGARDDDAAWLLGMASMVAADPIGQALYLAHVGDETHRFLAIKEWAYRVAVGFAGAKGSGQRRRSMIEAYRADWGQQAARDGVAIALWGAEGVPGIVARAATHKCGKQSFQRVRDCVQNRTTDMIGDYRLSLRWANQEMWSGDHVDRWEQATGRPWPAAR